MDIKEVRKIYEDHKDRWIEGTGYYDPNTALVVLHSARVLKWNPLVGTDADVDGKYTKAVETSMGILKRRLKL